MKHHASSAIASNASAPRRGFVRSLTTSQLATGVLIAAVGGYLLTTFLVSALPGLSRLVHASLAILVLALGTKAATSRLRLSAEPLILAFWLFFAYAFASVLWSGEPDAALVRAVGVFFDLLGATAIWVAMRNGVGVRWLGAFMGLGAAVQATIGLGQYAAVGGTRVGGLTGNANELALQLSMAAFVIIASVVDRRSWWHVYPLVLIVVATIVSGSQKMVIVWLAYLALIYRSALPYLRSRALSGLVLLSLPLAGLAIWTYGDIVLQPVRSLVVVERLEQTLEGEESSSLKRVSMVRDALRVWSTSPIVGHGIDQYRWLGPFGTYSHNNYTEVLADFGVVGLVLVYAIPVALIVWVAPRAWRGDRRAWLIVVVTSMLLLLDIGIVSYLSDMHWTMLAIMIGLAARLDEDVAHVGLSR